MEIAGKMLSPKEFAARSGFSIAAVYNAIHDGRLPHSRPLGGPRSGIRISEEFVSARSGDVQDLAAVDLGNPHD